LQPNHGNRSRRAATAYLLSQLPLAALVQCGDEGAARHRVTLNVGIAHVVEHVDGCVQAGEQCEAV